MTIADFADEYLSQIWGCSIYRFVFDYWSLLTEDLVQCLIANKLKGAQ
ncbi:hypothetical protein HanPI659440_Chr02g0043561 [Helianthus annuus]|uniref:Uncharacterized protein n=1 Tax=Helianthus annuus TaxID=4232 RepID=A0A9K3JMA7_HELAN|nr:hypothetical protein HanXRQr2_Chr02g0057421 [Helianthus annuus]KAJ0804917.1 hypothetical protein HanPI659440_Chr02g0043561 [Helianthus annuus]KAJ0951173.1 hypothetical protein HanPSC8_Chr02g0056861 [Helianthus annuus]